MKETKRSRVQTDHGNLNLRTRILRVEDEKLDVKKEKGKDKCDAKDKRDVKGKINNKYIFYTYVCGKFSNE
jgi:hypothetical protein